MVIINKSTGKFKYQWKGKKTNHKKFVKILIKIQQSYGKLFVILTKEDNDRSYNFLSNTIICMIF